MGIVLDLIPVEKDRIEQLRQNIKVYYSLEEEKSVWIRILRENAASQNQTLKQDRISRLLNSYSDLSLSYSLWKDWDVLHYLLCGSMKVIEDEYLSKAVLGGEQLFSNKKWNYSPPLLLSTEETRYVAISLKKVTEADIRKRYDPKIIAELCYEVSTSSDNSQAFTQIIKHLKDTGYKYYWNQTKKITHYYSLTSLHSMAMLKSWS